MKGTKHPLPLAQRIHRWIQNSTNCSGECWIWTGRMDRNGYAHVNFDGKTSPAHRFFYEYFRGPIPDGMEIDHLCRKRNCMNPFHLEVVTHAVNMRRAVGVGQYDRSKINTDPNRTHCSKRRGLKSCIKCREDNARAIRKAKAAKSNNERQVP